MSALVLHCAVRVLPEPASATALQPLIELAPSLKFTLPVGAAPLTAAVKVTFTPKVEGLAELDRIVLLAALTTCDSVVLIEAALLESPP